MKNTFSIYVCLVRLFRRCKPSYVNLFFVYRNPCVVSPLIQANPKKSSFIVNVWFPLVLPVYRLTYVAQIANSIVTRVAVDVVNKLSRPLAIKIKPSKPLGGVGFVIDAYALICGRLAASLTVWRKSLALFFYSCELARFGVVIKKLFEALRRKYISPLSGELSNRCWTAVDNSAFRPLSLVQQSSIVPKLSAMA